MSSAWTTRSASPVRPRRWSSSRARPASRAASSRSSGGDGSVNLVVNGLAGTTGHPRGVARRDRRRLRQGHRRRQAGPRRPGCSPIRRPSTSTSSRVTAGVEQRRFINVAGAGFDSAVAEVGRGDAPPAGLARALRARDREDAPAVRPGEVPHGARRIADRRRCHARRGREQLRVRRRDEGAPAGVDRRRAARYLYRDRHEQGGVPPRVPEGLRRASTPPIRT